MKKLEIFYLNGLLVNRESNSFLLLKKLSKTLYLKSKEIEKKKKRRRNRKKEIFYY